MYRYLIQTEEDFELLLEHIKEVDVFAYDVETNAKMSKFEVQLVGISFGFDLFSCYIPLLHNSEEPQLDVLKVVEAIKPIFENPESRYIAHNAKFDEKVLLAYGINCAGIGEDTLVMAWMLAEDASSKSLKNLTREILKVKTTTYEEVVTTRTKRGVVKDYNFANVPMDKALDYAAADAYFTYQLFQRFSKQLQVEKIEAAYERIERPFVRVLRNIEDAGVNIDLEYLDIADEKLPKVVEEVETSIYEEAGEVFNIGSTKQLGDVLFNKLKIGTNVPRTAQGNYSTDKKTLQTYAAQHEIVSNVLRRKKIQKTHSVFVKGLKPHVEKDGKVHPSFNGCGTATGRLSCSSPNLQQIEADEVEQIKVRNFFIPSPGNVFVVADYSQIELRVMAHVAKDKNAIQAFKDGKNFHEETARSAFNLADDAPIPPKLKVAAKTLNFGIPYGRGPFSIAEQLGLVPTCKGAECGECGKCYVENWFKAFPQVRIFKEHVIEDARKKGFVRTLSGRKRRLPNIRKPYRRGTTKEDRYVNALIATAERQAFNTKIQGSAADLIKLAMIALDPLLEELNARIVIQIHDELVVECPTEIVDDVKSLVKNTMENPLNNTNPLCLPLVTEPSVVTRWGDAK